MASSPTPPPAPSEPRRAQARGNGTSDATSSQQDISSRLYPRGGEVTTRRSEPSVPQEIHYSLIDPSTAVNGKLRTEGDLQIEGLLEGELDCLGRVFIAEGARVVARIGGRTVVVAGEVEGDIVCQERFEALATARVSGSVRTPQLTVHEGATMDGSITMSSGGPAIAVTTDESSPTASGNEVVP